MNALFTVVNEYKAVKQGVFREVTKKTVIV